MGMHLVQSEGRMTAPTNVLFNSIARDGSRPPAALQTIRVFFTLQTVCSALFAQRGSDQAAHAVIAFIFLFYAAYDVAFSPLIVSYTVEILPYQLRAKGLSIFNFTISAALIFNQYVNPIALGHLGWKYYIVYVCWLAFEAVFLWFYVVETKNRTLEETAVLFDGEDATEQIAGQAAQQAHITHELPVSDEKSSASFQEDNPGFTKA